MESLNLQVVAVLMPLEIKHHTVPHLKALTRSIERRGGLGPGSTFKQRYTVMKSTILLHKCTVLNLTHKVSMDFYVSIGKIKLLNPSFLKAQIW